MLSQERLRTVVSVFHEIPTSSDNQNGNPITDPITDLIINFLKDTKFSGFRLLLFFCLDGRRALSTEKMPSGL